MATLRNTSINEAIISFKDVSHIFTSNNKSAEVLCKLSFEVGVGEFLVLVGPSGCGKTTILNLIAGFLMPTEGSVLVQNINDVSDIGYIFQKDSLFPWKTVRENILSGNKVRQLDKRKREDCLNHLIKKMDLTGFDKYYPHQLSGGMAQRTVLARALANKPKVLLMDEPFSRLDSPTKVKLQEFLLSLWKELNLTIIFVTHDINEALLLSERIIVLGNRPSKVINTFYNPLPRPRSRITTTSVQFNELTCKILEYIFTENDR